MDKKENKSSKGSIIAIVILSILVVGLCGYIVYDKMSTKESTNTEKAQKSDKNNTKYTNDNKTDDSKGTDSKTDSKDSDSKNNNSQTTEEKENSKDCSQTVRCYGTYYVNGDTNDLKYILSEDGTYRVEGKEDFGVFTINSNTITFLQMKHTVGPREEDPYYENPRIYLISDDCSKIRLTSSGSEISATLIKVN